MKMHQSAGDQSRDIASKIGKKDLPDLPDLHSLEHPLHKALWALAAAEDVGWTSPMAIKEIQSLLEELKVSITSQQVTNALSRSGNKVIRKNLDHQKAYRIAQTGRVYLRKFGRDEGIEIVYAEPGKKWTVRKKLNELAGTLRGELLLLDRYYGERTLFVLEELAQRKEKVRFLTCETRENQAKLRASFHDLTGEKPNLEVRIYPKKYEMHDRFILGEDALIIVGHGIKDLGGSESFVIRLSKSTAGDLMDLVRSNFENRWQKSAGV